MTTYKNYEFFPEMKAAAAEKFGEGNYLLLWQDSGWNNLLPPSYAPAEPSELVPAFFREETWKKDGDKYTHADGDGSKYWTAVANPGWPLSVDFEERPYSLDDVDSKGVARYRSEDGRRVLRARLTDAGLDVWDPVALAAAPFPAILGRNYIEDSDLSAALDKKGVEVKETELGWVSGGILSRLEYTWQGQPRVAYEVTGQGDVDSFLSTSVVLAEPRRVDERDLDWVARMVKEAPDPRPRKH